MAGVRVLGTPPLPWLAGFAETNVGLYAVDDQGRRGVVFRSLEAAAARPAGRPRRGRGLHVDGEPHVLWSPGVDVRIGRPALLPR